MGARQGFEVIPEFLVQVDNDPGEEFGRSTTRISGEKHPKQLDLVWAVRKPRMPKFQDRPAIEYWDLYATFEIEGCNVWLDYTFYRHLYDLPKITNTGDDPLPIAHHVPLYKSRHDHAPMNCDPNGEVQRRRDLAESCGVSVGSIDDPKWLRQLARLAP